MALGICQLVISLLSHNHITGLPFSALLHRDSIDRLHHTLCQLLALCSDGISSSEVATRMENESHSVDIVEWRDS